jgi:hypothetical protein
MSERTSHWMNGYPHTSLLRHTPMLALIVFRPILIYFSRGNRQLLQAWIPGNQAPERTLQSYVTGVQSGTRW